MALNGCLRNSHLWKLLESRFISKSITTSSRCATFRTKKGHVYYFNQKVMKDKFKERARHPWIPREASTKLFINNEWVHIPEMCPDIIVPSDLDKCDLKPYVDWKTPLVHETELSPEKLFATSYSSEITDLYIKGKISLDDVIDKYDSKHVAEDLISSHVQYK